MKQLIQNEMMIAIKEHGVDLTAKMLAEYVNQKITTEDVAIQFILEELEAASQGNAVAKQFASTSGFDENDYQGAMHNSFEEVDGPNGPQQLILNLCMMLYPDQNLMAELRIKAVDNIMKIWGIGKYAAISHAISLMGIVQKTNHFNDGVFANINNDLNESITKDHSIIILMAYGYARRIAAAGLFLQGIFSRKDYQQASNVFNALQLQTGQTVEFQEEAYSQALKYIQSYDGRLDRNTVGKMVVSVENKQVVCAKDHGAFYTDDQVVEIFES